MSSIPALAYVIGGGMLTTRNASPYFGLGFGWNPRFLPNEPSRRFASFMALCLVMFGRLELRLHPSPNPTTSVLLGLGF